MQKFKKILLTVLIALSVSVPVVSATETASSNISYSQLVSDVDSNLIESAKITEDNSIVLYYADGAKTAEFSESAKKLLEEHNIVTTEENSLKTAVSKNNKIFLPHKVKKIIILVSVWFAIYLVLTILFSVIRKAHFKKAIKQDLTDFDAFIRDELIRAQNRETTSHATPDMTQASAPTWRTPHRNNAGPPQQNRNKKKYSLKDVEGLDELKEDILRIVDYLKNPDKYKKLGARTPKGIILYGPPGTGKTLIAKAIAGEANVNFISACGSDFVEKYVGVGPQRVRDLYKKARSQAPCIVFIDEIDAVAGRREADSNSEDLRTTNALLAELDGFNSTEGIITICATNRLDMLDSAFQRAGRFDLKLAVSLPDVEAREKILLLHAKNKVLSPKVDLKNLALKTNGFSGADLEALLNESALLAASHDLPCITDAELEEAFFKIVMKGNKKKNKDDEKIKKLIAYHEAGHTLATKLLTDDSVPTVTIVGSTSGAGGVTFRTPKEIILHSKKYLENLVKVMYAGRAAEEIFLGTKEDITTGASQDIKQATNIIREYISSYGLGSAGMLDLSQFSNDYKSILEEAKTLSISLYNASLELLETHSDTLKNLAERLYEKETLTENEIDAIIFGETFSDTNMAEDAAIPA